jgi:hypothetical protein
MSAKNQTAKIARQYAEQVVAGEILSLPLGAVGMPEAAQRFSPFQGQRQSVPL